MSPKLTMFVVEGSWRPTMNQLMELTSRPEAEDMMTTSFIDADNDNDNDNYTPDWESDSSDDSEDHSSSSGEFIWRVSEDYANTVWTVVQQVLIKLMFQNNVYIFNPYLRLHFKGQPSGRY